ncbi:MAG: hypothetical protein Q4A41_05900 [Bacillota bacterium]|nr:hypothetical protein [Bacillota bacterium]
MNTLKQLIRRPPVLTATIFLLLVASAFLSLSLGVYFSARKSFDNLNDRFVIVAYPGRELCRWTYGANKKVLEFIDQIKNNRQLVDSFYDCSYVDGNVAGLKTLVSFQFKKKYNPSADYPYYCVLITAKVLDIGEPYRMEYRNYYPETGGVSLRIIPKMIVPVTGEIEKIVKMHHGYEISKKEIDIRLRFHDIGVYNENPLEKGKTYLFTGWYVDSALLQINETARLVNLPSEHLMDYYIPYTEEEIRRCIEDQIEQGISEPDVFLGRIYNTELKIGISVTPEKYKMLNSIRLFCDSDTMSLPYTDPSSDGTEWQKIRNNIDLSYTQVPVVGTNKLERMFEFHFGEMFISKGTGFSSKDYSTGNNVCVISQELAELNHLHLGDTIELSYRIGNHDDYSGILEIDPIHTKEELVPTAVSEQSEPMYKADYKIVGFYRMKNTWEFDYFTITPNTVFVPKKSIKTECITLDSGPFLALEIKKDAVDAFSAAVSESGIPQSHIKIYDNGYMEMRPIMKSFGESATWLLVMGLSVCVVVMATYIVLFVVRRKKEAGLMISLGASKKMTAAWISKMALLPVMTASITGSAIGLFFIDNVIQEIYRDAVETSSISESVSSAMVHSVQTVYGIGLLGGIMQIIVYAALIRIVAKRIVHISPMKLMK